MSVCVCLCVSVSANACAYLCVCVCVYVHSTQPSLYWSNVVVVFLGGSGGGSRVIVPLIDNSFLIFIRTVERRLHFLLNAK